MNVLPIAGASLPITGVRSYLYARSDTHKHRGIDLPAAEGSPVLAARAGVVTHAHPEPDAPGFKGYGSVVVLEHPGHFWTLYAHLSSVNVHKGQRVAAGEAIGAVGHTGNATGPVLHFEVSSRPYPLVKESPRLDPVAWLQDKGGALGGGIALLGLGLGWLFLRSRGL